MTYESGKIVPESGIYKDLDTGNEVTCVKGEPFPPSVYGFTLVRKTKHS